MNKRSIAMLFRLLIIIFCFIMALLSALGVGTLDEPHGRLIFSMLWICVGILAVIRYLMERNRR
jgi:hypothetical protein